MGSWSRIIGRIYTPLAGFLGARVIRSFIVCPATGFAELAIVVPDDLDWAFRRWFELDNARKQFVVVARIVLYVVVPIYFQPDVGVCIGKK